MRFAAKISIATLIIVAAAMAIGLWSYWPTNIDICLTNGDLAAPEREPYEKTALHLAEDMVRGNLKEIYSQTTADAKRTIPLNQLAALLQAYSKPMAALAPLRITHSYFLRSSWGTGAEHVVLCPAVVSGTISRPEDKVFVSMKSSGEQAHVIVEGDGNAGTWNFVFWLMREEGVWRMQSLHFGPIAFSGKSATDYLTRAREQRDVGHMFNAAMLYLAASSLAFRGNNFQLGIGREIEADVKNLRFPPLLEGQTPYLWQFGKNSFRVLNVRPFFAGGETDLTIRVELPSLNDAKVIEAQSHALIGHLTNAYPEIFGSFDAIVVEAVEPNGVRSYRTVQYGHEVPEKATVR